MGSDRIVLKDSDRVFAHGVKAASGSRTKLAAAGPAGRMRKAAWVFPPLAPPEPAPEPTKLSASRRPSGGKPALRRGVFATYVSPRLFAATISRSSAVAMLLVAAFFWGAGNVANKTVLTHLDAYTAVTLRCALASLVILPFVRAETTAPRLPGWLGSASAVALLFAASLILQQIAYQWTSVTNASFLVNICTVLTPLLAWALLRERQPKRIIFAAFVTLAGAALMSGVNPASTQVNPGDLACLAAALCYAGWMVALGRHATRHGRPFATCLVQFAVAAVLTSGIVAATQSPTLTAIGQALPELIILGVFSTALAFALQTYAQRFVPSSTAAVLVSGESLFGAAGAALLLGERVPLAAGIGAGLIFAAILLVATWQAGEPHTASAPRLT